MIKADVQGEVLQVLQGAIRTIQEQQPVLALTIYSGTEILEVPKFIADLGFYDIRYYFGCARWDDFFSYTMLAYPRHVLYVDREDM
jgi:hypothetical protein